MFHTQRRFLSIVAAGSAALAIAASPAFAGSSGCAGGDCQDEDQPAPVVPVVPTPVPVAAPQAPAGGESRCWPPSSAASSSHGAVGAARRNTVVYATAA